jgi:hypothetical protein
MELIPYLEKNPATSYSLEPLAASGWFFSAEITSDTTHFANDHLELFFDNKYNLALKEPVPSSLK